MKSNGGSDGGAGPVVGSGVEVGISDTHTGLVLMHFGHPVDHFTMSPEQASTMAEHMSRAAFKCHYGREAPERGSELARQVKAKAVDELRPRLIARAELTIRSLLEQEKSLAYIAEHTVDAVLREVEV